MGNATLLVSLALAFLAGWLLARRAAASRQLDLLDDRGRLRLAQQLARIGSWDLDLEDNRLVWSDEIFRIFEIDPAGFAASYEGFLNAVHPDDRAAVNEAYQASVRDRVPYAIAHRLLMPDGRIKHVQETGQTYYGPKGQPRRSLGTVQDITERKLIEDEHRRAHEARQQAEAALLESEHRLQAAADVSKLGIFDHDHLAGTIYWSPRQREIYGWGPNEAVTPGDFLSLVHKDDLDAIGAAVKRAHDPGEGVFDVEHRIVRRDGAVRWLKARSQTFFGGEGAARRPLRTIGAIIDISSRKETEEERENLLREMEARNAELERFTYTVSHDLKSPLITIKGFLGYLEKDRHDGNTERITADIGRITSAADRMDRLLRELLDLSRIGRVVNAPESLAFDEIVGEAVELVTGRLGQRGVAIEIAPDLPRVHGDRVRLVEVVQNLLDNAAKFMGDQPRPLIQIGARHSNHRDMPVFFVRDNGIGIDSAYHEKVFGLFDKLDKRSDGTGIGLAVVKRIIETHGGDIWIESAGEAGSGVTVCFTLSPPPPVPDEKAPPVL